MALLRPRHTLLPPTLLALLDRSAEILSGLGEGYEECLRGLGALRGRLEQGRLHLPVLGQFRRGKSTLLNALLGEPVLPTSVGPVTAIPPLVFSGEVTALVVHVDEGLPPVVAAPGEPLPRFLDRFVTEGANPKNRPGVSHVEVWHLAPILRAGVVLIATPGIGSTFRHNTEATRPCSSSPPIRRSPRKRSPSSERCGRRYVVCSSC